MSSLWEVIEVDTTVLEQYVELKEEIKDLHNRIDRDRRRLVKICLLYTSDAADEG